MGHGREQVAVGAALFVGLVADELVDDPLAFDTRKLGPDRYDVSLLSPLVPLRYNDRIEVAGG